MQKLVYAVAGGSLVFIMLFATMSVCIAGVIYLVARWRSHHEGQRGDPQLGVKTAVGFFAVLAFQTLLVSLVMLIFGLLSEGSDDAKKDLLRVAAGLLVPSLIVLGVHAALARFTNHGRFPVVLRLCEGWNMLVVGMLGFVALTALFVGLFQEDPDKELMRFLWSFAIVYGAAWAVALVRFWLSVQGAASGDASAEEDIGAPL